MSPLFQQKQQGIFFQTHTPYNAQFNRHLTVWSLQSNSLSMGPILTSNVGTQDSPKEIEKIFSNPSGSTGLKGNTEWKGKGGCLANRVTSVSGL